MEDSIKRRQNVVLFVISLELWQEWLGRRVVALRNATHFNQDESH